MYWNSQTILIIEYPCANLIYFEIDQIEKNRSKLGLMDPVK